MSQSSQGDGLTNEQRAWAFLEEDGLEIADEQNVAALMAVGFRTKQRFLRSIKISAAADGALVKKLQASLGDLDWLLLLDYLKEQGLAV